MIGDFQKLMAESYDKGNPPDDKETKYWIDRAAEANGSILELGSGTGRLLIPLVEKGFEVSGLDSSEEMIKICETKISGAGRALPRIYRESMPVFELEDRFRLIFLADGGLSLFTSDRQIAALLSTVYDHLEPNGRFIFEAILYSKDEGDDFRGANEWRGDYYRIDDSTIITQKKYTKYDRATHCWETPVIYEKFENGMLTETEMNVRVGRLFCVDEILNLLSQSKFQSYSVTDWVSSAPVTESSGIASFTCTR